MNGVSGHRLVEVYGLLVRRRCCLYDSGCPNGAGYSGKKMFGSVDGYGEPESRVGPLRCVNSRSHPHDPSEDIDKGPAAVALIDHCVGLNHSFIGDPVDHQIPVQVAHDPE